MRILIVAATSIEIAPLSARLNERRPPIAAHNASSARARGPGDDQNAPVLSPSNERLTAHVHGAHAVDVLITGVGMVATAAWTARVLAETRYDLALNLGVCGSFNRALPLGGVVHVVTDRIAELGAEDKDRFLPIEELRLPTDHTFVTRPIPDNAVLRRLPTVNGITVNTVHGNEESIAAVVRRFNPDVETMEGAGFMQACQIHQAVCAQVRAVSNLVQQRNREAWRLDEAIDGLCRTALEILETT